MSEKPKEKTKDFTDAYMKELEAREAEECEERKKDPYAFNLQKLYEEDIKELDNIIDEQ